jgi:hypothetical protein
MMKTFLVILPLLVLGCAQMPLTYQPDPESVPVLSMDPNIFGRGCLYMIYEEGSLEMVVIQDGSSDWSLSRLLAWIADVVPPVFGGGERSGTGMAGPSDIVACASLFGGSEDEPEVEAEVE